MSLEFMGNFYGKGEILSYAYDYEQATMLRRPPALVPPLQGEVFTYEPVPEPSFTAGLAVLGLGALGIKPKRWRRAKIRQ